MDKRVKFDFEIEFTNGGGIQGQDFRLDIAGEDISDQELAAYLVNDMRLLMAGEVRILNKEIITEKHKRQPGEASSGQRSAATSPRGGGNEGGRSYSPVLIDLSHTIEHGLITYKGLPAPIICDYLSREESRKFYEPGTEFQIGKIEMVANTGTYLDCPFHRYAHGKDLSEVELDCFAELDGLVVRAGYQQGLAVDASFFKDKELRGRAVLVHTGWGDDHWNTERYYENHPFLTEDAALYLREVGVRLVGIDSHNIDNTQGKSRPVHSTLLGAEILIVEHMCNLGQLPDEGFVFSATPPKFKGMGTFPVRAMARLK